MTPVTPTMLAMQQAYRPVEVLPPVEITTQRLFFRPLSLADRPAVLDAIAASRDTLAGRIPLNHDDESDDAMFTRWVESAAECDNNRSAWRRAAFLDDGTFIGLFNLIKIEFGLEWTCEINWWVDRRCAGLGYASEAVDAVLRFATDEMPTGLGITRVRAMIQPDNAASIRVAEKAGMRPTGATDLLPVDGEHRTHHAYECIPALIDHPAQGVGVASGSAA